MTPHHLSRPQLLRAAVLCAVLAFACLGLATTAHCQEQPHETTLRRVTLASLVTLAAVDVAQTTGCIHAGHCDEGNPLLRPVASSYWRMSAIKAAVIVPTWALSSTVRKQGHPKLAWALLGAVTGAQAIAVGLNVRTVRREGKR